MLSGGTARGITERAEQASWLKLLLHESHFKVEHVA
jgi:hypothetical protein